MHTPPSAPAFSAHVAYDGELPLDLQSCEQPSAAQLAMLGQRGAQLLATLEALENQTSADDDAPRAHDLVRIDTKLNALLALLNQTLMPDDALPPSARIRLNAWGLSCDRALPRHGTQVRIRLHFDACRAMPLELTGTVNDQESARYVALDDMGEALHEALQRMVFRQHRRSVAEQRLSRDAD